MWIMCKRNDWHSTTQLHWSKSIIIMSLPQFYLFHFNSYKTTSRANTYTVRSVQCLVFVFSSFFFEAENSFFFTFFFMPQWFLLNTSSYRKKRYRKCTHAAWFNIHDRFAHRVKRDKRQNTKYINIPRMEATTTTTKTKKCSVFVCLCVCMCSFPFHIQPSPVKPLSKYVLVFIFIFFSFHTNREEDSKAHCWLKRKKRKLS